MVLLCLLCALAPSNARAAARNHPAIHSEALIRKAVALQIANDKKMPALRFRYTKTTPHGIFVKEVIETHGGEVSRLISINGKPLSAGKAAQEQQRLTALLSHPSDQARHRRHQVEHQNRVDRLIRELPQAFLFHFAGTEPGPHGPVLHFTFVPNPHFSPPDLESRALTGMTGNIWINQSTSRFVRLNAHLIHSIRVGWGIVAKFDKGGTVSLVNHHVGRGYWTISHLKLDVNGSALIFKPIHIDITEDESHFHFLPSSITWRQAVAMLTKNPASLKQETQSATNTAKR